MGQSVRLVMQTPLQVLSAKPKEAVLFMDDLKHLRKLHGKCECVWITKRSAENAPLCLFGTRGDVCIHKHTIPNVEMYSLRMANPSNIRAECALPLSLTQVETGLDFCRKDYGHSPEMDASPSDA